MYSILHVFAVIGSIGTGFADAGTADRWISAAVRPVAFAPHVSFGARTIAPFESLVFCKEFAASCRAEDARAGVAAIDGRVVLTEELMSRVISVNATVNRQMKPKVDGSWHVGGRTGDCEDFALTKRDMLNRIGFPTSATLVATALAPSGRMHAVLIVRSDRGDYVLDNLTPAVRRFEAVPYGWDKVQSPGDPKVWVTVLVPPVS